MSGSYLQQKKSSIYNPYNIIDRIKTTSNTTNNENNYLFQRHYIKKSKSSSSTTSSSTEEVTEKEETDVSDTKTSSSSSSTEEEIDNKKLIIQQNKVFCAPKEENLSVLIKNYENIENKLDKMQEILIELIKTVEKNKTTSILSYIPYYEEKQYRDIENKTIKNSNYIESWIKIKSWKEKSLHEMVLFQSFDVYEKYIESAFFTQEKDNKKGVILGTFSKGKIEENYSFFPREWFMDDKLIKKETICLPITVYFRIVLQESKSDSKNSKLKFL